MHSVTFLFPRTGEIPIGGFKVVYEYANRLVKDGYSVNIVYGIVSRPVTNPIIRFAYYFLRFFRWIKYLSFKDYRPSSWFETDDKINHLLRYSLSEKKIPKTDIYIATAWSTAFWLNRYKNVDCRNKFYFIQHFEDWAETYDAVLETWKMKLTKIVIAPWLQKIATDIGEKCFLVENGFNQNEFYLIDTIEDRKKTAIMLWHDLPFKGCSMGIEALKHVKEVIPEFTVTLFGVPFPPPNLPSWIKYYQKPKIDIHRKLYNNAAIFVGTSYSEGWGLTVGEAMLCGCAIACTNNEGYAVVAHDNETALLSEIGDAVALSENIIHLIENDNLRIKIATSGNKLIKEYTWERAYKNFLTVIDI